MAATFLKWSTMDRSIVTVDRFDRMVTPKYPIKRHVLPICKAIESKSIQLICLDTNTLESLDPIFFYTHFRTFGGFEIEIWLSGEGEIDA